MGNTIAFDTYAYVRKLRDAGLTEQQAVIQAEALVSLIEERLATKKDLAEVEASLKRDIEKIRSDLQRDLKELDTKAETRLKELDIKAETRSKETDARLKELELRMVIKMGGMILAGIGILFGFMRAWPLPVQFVPFPGQEMRQTVSQFPPGK
ncbi:MAG: hypothetical protein HQL84_08145 [Magnetococcales bacterium]|nr:hypothetical protein [Magnetococcales bacterium]MBF0150001.1 hypothetical protein [Magnetococcales bacterium]MBF0174244.1 hypothetical protein [Magnetococcales bacterium]MBF0632873.1 hypothetical protein [Magnetococcales bacterium]